MNDGATETPNKYSSTEPNPLKALLHRKPDGIVGEFVRYAVCGGLAFALDFTLLVALTEVAGLHYLLAAGFSFVAGLTVIYILSVSMVFRWRVYDDKLVEFGFFALCGVVGLAFNQLFMYLFTGIGGLHYTIAKVFAAAGVLGWNFSSRKILLFRRQHVEPP
jgi:putative flippase GtrA